MSDQSGSLSDGNHLQLNPRSVSVTTVAYGSHARSYGVLGCWRGRWRRRSVGVNQRGLAPQWDWRSWPRCCGSNAARYRRRRSRSGNRPGGGGSAGRPAVVRGEDRPRLRRRVRDPAPERGPAGCLHGGLPPAGGHRSPGAGKDLSPPGRQPEEVSSTGLPAATQGCERPMNRRRGTSWPPTPPSP
jgi:hypothetical protein